MKRIVKEGQSLVDIALETCGAVEATWVLANRNGISVTERLELGTVIAYEREDVADSRVADKYALEGIEPATEVSAKTLRWLLKEEEFIETPCWAEIETEEPTPQKTRAARENVFGEEFNKIYG